jgi:hypothetical protein
MDLGTRRSRLDRTETRGKPGGHWTPMQRANPTARVAKTPLYASIVNKIISTCDLTIVHGANTHLGEDGRGMRITCSKYPSRVLTVWDSTGYPHTS